MRKWILALMALSFFGGLQAQERAVSELEETGLWMGLYLKGKINKHWYYYGEHHYRRRNSIDNTYDFVGRMRQVYNRAGINYVHSEYFNVVLGPTLVFNYTPQPGNENFETVTLEPRIWHQWLFSMPYMGRLKIYHQFRFEHRWKRDNNLDADYKYTDRYRYKLYAYIPLNKPKLQNKTWFLAPSAEIFIETGKSKVYNQLEDFRVYTGIGYILNSKITFFGGHMWTIGTKASGFEFRESHIIRLNVFYNFDFRNPQRVVPSVLMGD